MKRTFVKIVSKKFMAVAAILALLSTASISEAKAAEETATSAVEYTGAVNNSISFNIKYNNETGSVFNLTVKNESGDIIYSHSYNTKDFSKKFMISELPEDGGNVTFIIDGAAGTYKKSFSISTTTKTVSDFAVTAEK